MASNTQTSNSQPQPPRHQCRNPRCRSKLPAPVENEPHAFCCRGCFEFFYRTRCRVCERDLRKTGKRGDAGRLYCRPPAKCKQEAQKWPEKYRHGQSIAFPTTKLRSAHSTGLKFGIAGHPPTAHCLRGWWWGDPGIGDHSLYDADGLTVARIVLDADGHYHLRTPITVPQQSWVDLDAAKRGAESFAMMAMVVDRKLAARIKIENSTPHPMGLPPNRELFRENAVASGWMPSGAGSDVPPIPDFLRRPAVATTAGLEASPVPGTIPRFRKVA